jgi:uncharacterized protein (TIGR03067 family)
MLVVIVAALACLGASTGQKPDKAVEAELKLLDGEWKVIAAEMGGEPCECNDQVVFSGGKCTVTNPATKIVLENTIALDPSKMPKRMVVTNTQTKEVWVGIYELKEGKLRALFYGGKDAPKAPTGFKTEKGSLQVMYTCERVKPK